jgi:hypothetical protein
VNSLMRAAVDDCSVQLGADRGMMNRQAGPRGSAT